ncbi:MAG: hypothetical protein WC747_01305 [Candidatus Babeliales bacterium]|jgi:hypothetical protein
MQAAIDSVQGSRDNPSQETLQAIIKKFQEQCKTLIETLSSGHQEEFKKNVSDKVTKRFNEYLKRDSLAAV